MPEPAEPSVTAAIDASPDPHDRELRGVALALSDGSGFRLAIATFGDTGIRDVLIDRLTARLAADGVTLTRLDVASLVPPDEREARQEFSLLAALRDHCAGLTAAQQGAKIAISVVGLEHFISEFSDGGLDVLATANLQRELFPKACPVPVVLWLPPWATTLLAQKAPDLWHWRTATFDFPGGGAPPSALTAWPELTREEWWRPVDGERLGELTEELEALRRSEGGEDSPRARAYAARLRVRLADARYSRGTWDEALSLLVEAREAYERLGDMRSRAVTMGQIADILQARGQLDEALRIRKEEQLPVYERLGDVRERAVTMGQIADILQARGQLDEALRIRMEEQLPVYERLGDVRELLVGRANLAQMLLIRNTKDDRPEAHRLLCLALADARRLGLPEAAQIERLLTDAGLACN
ncbi:MAG: tetratricopeptide repeat protein [Defluviicoccus sp.]